jgi:two-component system, OmpR family, response regulator
MEKILIVDDEVDICYFLSINLTKNNFSTSYVNTISEAKKAITREFPAILLLDNHLPDGFGVDFALEVKLINPDVKIVMITAHDTPTDRKIAERNGVDFFLAKPFLINDVYKAIEFVTTPAA